MHCKYADSILDVISSLGREILLNHKINHPRLGLFGTLSTLFAQPLKSRCGWWSFRITFVPLNKATQTKQYLGLSVFLFQAPLWFLWSQVTSQWPPAPLVLSFLPTPIIFSPNSVKRKKSCSLMGSAPSPHAHVLACPVSPPEWIPLSWIHSALQTFVTDREEGWCYHCVSDV